MLQCGVGDVRTREKETSERRHQLKARETAVQFYREKVTSHHCVQSCGCLSLLQLVQLEQTDLSAF